MIRETQEKEEEFEILKLSATDGYMCEGEQQQKNQFFFVSIHLVCWRHLGI